jgi:small subunit ribosomal protein S6
MRTYETVYILDPQLEDDAQNALVDRFQTLVGSNGGEVLHLDRWERRRMAYEIKGRREGYYVVMNFRGEPATEAELNRVFGITDGVLRHMIVRMDERTAERQIADAKTAVDAKAKAAADARAAAEAQAAEAAAAQAAAAAAAPAPTAPPPAAPAPAAAAEAAPAAEEPAAPAAEESATGAPAEEPAAAAPAGEPASEEAAATE